MYNLDKQAKLSARVFHTSWYGIPGYLYTYLRKSKSEISEIPEIPTTINGNYFSSQIYDQAKYIMFY